MFLVKRLHIYLFFCTKRGGDCTMFVKNMLNF